MNSLRKFRPVVTIVAAMLFSGMTIAQVNSSEPAVSEQHDVFTSVHESLSDAADRTLAVALADKPWMQPTEVTPLRDGRSEKVAIGDSVARVRAAVERVNQLRPTIEPILRQEGVPVDVSAVVLVESGGLPMAYSPKGARGIWQFMPDTARRYGLVVSAERDDRIDITLSTHAAARYLRDLYQQFGDWQLAFAAYNAGEGAVERALGRVGQHDFTVVRHALPQETRNYVPAVLQAMSALGDSGALSVFRSKTKTGGRILFASASELGE
ncbi:MAG: lytic transglycosylase domain-containing protein [Acidobacteriaceae bacterium]